MKKEPEPELSPLTKPEPDTWISKIDGTSGYHIPSTFVRPSTYELLENSQVQEVNFTADDVAAVETQMHQIPPVISRSTHRMQELACEYSVPDESLHGAVDSAAMARDQCKQMLFERLSEHIEFNL
jgi:hypothetical protein